MNILRAMPVALIVALASAAGAADPEVGVPAVAEPDAVAPEAAAPEAAESEGTALEIRACMERNIPPRSSVQTVEFTAVDRVGGERMSRSKIYGKRLDDGFRRLKMRFVKPPYMRKSELLMIETKSSPDVFLYSPETRRARRVTSSGGGGSVFGTDFSYEDFERWQLFNRPGTLKRGPDTELGGTPVHVLWTFPADEANSQYEKIETFVHQETCVVLKMNSYEPGERLRKVLVADPKSLLEEGGIWVATDLVMRDVRDETYTAVVVEDIEVDEEVSDNVFQVSRMGRAGD
jgi:hypothetical protein